MTDFSLEVFEHHYKIASDRNINDTIDRMAKTMSSKEANPSEWEAIFRSEIESFRFIPAGRVWSNAGGKFHGTGMINCFVDGFWGEDQDSIHGIMKALSRQALILKSEGGYGFCTDVMRPRGSYIRGIGGDSPGSVAMLDLWQATSVVLTSGNPEGNSSGRGKKKVRNGAQMATKSMWHPDIVEFIQAKRQSGKLTKMNISVLVSNQFMKAVEEDSDWDLIFPDYEHDSARYSKTWDGDIDKWKKNGGHIRVYNTVKARYLWDLLMRSTYEFNDPGILFVDRMNEFNNLWYKEHISSTNPCGEQPLPKGGACLLGSVNLTKFVNPDYIKDNSLSPWNYTALRRTISCGVRFLDNVIEETAVPTKEQRDSLDRNRRIGLGIMGLGSALMMLGVRYGEESVQLVEELMSFFTCEAYMASVHLAKDKGAFPDFDVELYPSGKFISSLPSYIQDAVKLHGIRNSHVVSIQPTGTTAILAGVVSGGGEPVFAPAYERWMKMSKWVDGLPSFQSGKWKESCEGRDTVWTITHDGVDYKCDDNRGLTKLTVVEDYAIRHLRSIGVDTSNQWFVVGAGDISIADHMSVMGVLAKYVDSAISKTVNLPHDITYDEFKSLYVDAYNTGTIKGITTYRDGTMSHVLKVHEDTCPECQSKMTKSGGCSTCSECGYSACEVK